MATWCMITTSSAGGSSPVIFFLEFFCIDVRTFCAFHCVVEYAHAANGDANLEAHDKSADVKLGWNTGDEFTRAFVPPRRIWWLHH